MEIKVNEKELRRRLDLVTKFSFSNISAENNINFLRFIVEGNVKSQSNQDLIALEILKNKENGFYVEFGADDGVKNSNTFLLKEKFGWNGVLIEPNPKRFKLLKENRINDICLNYLIYNETGKSVDFTVSGQLSTIKSFSESDFMKVERKKNQSEIITLVTITLNDLLKEINAPTEIDFLSIDTEGSEFEILNSVDFDLINIKLICFEHNHTDNKIKIGKLLESKGYQEVLKFSGSIDSFYLK